MAHNLCKRDKNTIKFLLLSIKKPIYTTCSKVETGPQRGGECEGGENCVRDGILHGIRDILRGYLDLCPDQVRWAPLRRPRDLERPPNLTAARKGLPSVLHPRRSPLRVIFPFRIVQLLDPGEDIIAVGRHLGHRYAQLALLIEVLVPGDELTELGGPIVPLP